MYYVVNVSDVAYWSDFDEYKIVEDHMALNNIRCDMLVVFL